MPQRVARAAAAALALGLLSGCASGASADTGWRAKAACPDPDRVASVAGLTGLQFTVQRSTHETLATTGCAYRTANVALDVESDPGGPDDVQFGNVPGMTAHSQPALGSGAKSAISPTLCALVVPQRGGRSLQLQLVGRVDHLPACDRMPRLLRLFADEPAGH
jgi:hypothetical protein